MTKEKPGTSVKHSDEETASPPKKPATPTITSVSVKQQAQTAPAHVFIHEAKPTIH